MKKMVSFVVFGMSTSLVSGQTIAQNLEERVERLELTVEEIQKELKPSIMGVHLFKAKNYSLTLDCKKIEVLGTLFHSEEFIIRKKIDCEGRTFYIVKMLGDSTPRVIESTEAILY